MPRILITGFCAVPGPNRAGVQLRHVIRALAPRNTVDVLAMRAGDQAYVERQASARVLRVPAQADGSFRERVEAFRRALRRQLEGADYDIVHVRDGWSGIPVLELRARHRFAVVFDAARAPMSEMPSLDVDLAAEQSRDEEACLIGSDLVLVATPHARQYVSARGRGDRVHVVPPGVDVDRFDWDAARKSGPPIILCAGTLEPGRGVRVLLRAMVDVSAQVDARLVLAGALDPSFRAALVKGIRDLRLGDRVELLGAIDHAAMPDLIARATVCVAPSAAELTPRPTAVFPTKLLEYMACRRAVVAPRRGTVAGLVGHGTHGLLFTPGDPAALARAIVKLLADPPLRARLAQAGYELVRHAHTASATRRSLRHAYAALAEHPAWRERFLDAETAPGVEPPVTDALGLDDIEEIDATELDPRAPITQIDVRGETVTGVTGDITQENRIRVTDSGAFTTMDVPLDVPPPGAGTDDWVVAEGGRERAWSEVDDDGTPLDVQPAPTAPVSPVESQFVAGELDVPTPAPEPDLDADAPFTAVSTLLSGREDSGLTPTPVRERGDEPSSAGET